MQSKNGVHSSKTQKAILLCTRQRHHTIMIQTHPGKMICWQHDCFDDIVAHGSDT